MSMGRYEIIYILAPSTPDDTMTDLVSRFEGEITSRGGVLRRVEKWGRKKLAYEVRKFREGFFVLFLADCEGAVVAELERRFRMTDAVIKFMTVRIDEELKRAGKMPRDEELGAPCETERIDRSRRSAPKPPPAAAPSESREKKDEGGKPEADRADTGETGTPGDEEKTAGATAAAEEPAAEKPAAEKPAAEEPAAEDPADEEPAAEETADGEDDDK
jgi:small subunit ribosomal protein S6